MDTQQPVKTEKNVPVKKSIKRDYFYAVGRQKEAVARVRLYASVKDDAKWGEHPIKKQQILVNAQPIERYFPGPLAKAYYMKPLSLLQVFDKYAVTVKVEGGGRNGQLDAMIMGISRVLSLVNPTKFRPVMKTAGLLTRDARVRERRKVGTGGKARRKKQSPKR
jgi:small subunit ribosomal protein S9